MRKCPAVGGPAELQKREATAVLQPFKPRVLSSSSGPAFPQDSMMLPRCPVAVAVVFFLFSATRLAAADAPPPPQQDFHKKVGDSVIFPVRFPKEVQVTELFLRTTLDKRAVAIWQPGEALNVVDGRFSGRVTFSENPRFFNLSSLRLADGELYQVSVSHEVLKETVIHAYRLSVFNINATVDKLANGSCSLHLLCQAGMGPGTDVTYTWKATDSRSVLARGPRLEVVLHPADKDLSYTCQADRRTFLSQWEVAPYKQFCSSGVAGLLRPGFLACSFLAKALFLPMLVTVLMLP